MATPRPSFPPAHLVAVGMLEGVVLMIAVGRGVAVPGSVDFSKPAHLAWFVLTVVLAGLAPASFVLRSLAVRRREVEGQAEEGERRQVLVLSLALLAPALAVAIAGPRMMELLLAG
ncbi:MAG: hypothetical protein AB1938_15045 [Myxococcota bacterium]